jgi:hypothetical protein
MWRIRMFEYVFVVASYSKEPIREPLSVNVTLVRVQVGAAWTLAQIRHAITSGMRRKARRQDDRSIDFLKCRVVIVFVFISFVEVGLLNLH